MKFLFRLLLCSLIAFSAGCANQPSPARPAPTASTAKPAVTPLLLISIDGYRADYIQRGLSPALDALANDGVHAASMQPSFPSLTFPNHYTIVTGLRPDHHGIVNNTMVDPVLGKFSLSDRDAVGDGRWWDQGTPLWITASQHGLKSATMFWPGSEAGIHGQHPDFWQPYDGHVTPDQRVDQVLAWLDLPADQRPSFLTLYFDEVDHAGHTFGPDTPQVDQALRETDAALARLVQGLKQRGLFDRVNMIVLADHGMASVPAQNSILLDKVIPLTRVDVVSLGVLAGLNPTPGHDFAKIEAQLEKPQRHMTCWDKSRVPARLAYGSNPRVPQLLCLADVGWRITTTDFIAKKHGKLSLGEHGYDNASPLMQAVFVAHGPAFREGIKVASFPNVDVYPLMTHLLGLPAAANDGDYQAVKDMLRPEAQ
ncbi:alkaline phosphatase family protein [Dyella halodurans]|uniref:Ectonucleotide pyrophosphatase/phosphodiesterase n=1 Tax=Dyella halodurans TaxID=1920171 RepID=A0ABV9C2Y8_9GAMM|nr:ectonucleotide pyrophosphatase/phosphodiesterase [Dyella halodurans]